MKQSRKIKFISLDAMRGIVAIAVAVFHFSHQWGGYLAVDFFFVLSGFILTHSYLYKDRQTSVIDFISHRLARLYPLHVFTLLTFSVVGYLIYRVYPFYTEGTLVTCIQNLTLTHNIGLKPHELRWNYPSWSISIEFWVNIIFILFITKATRNITLLVPALLGLALIYYKTGNMDVQVTNYYTYINTGMIRGISSFFLGIISYRLYLRYRGSEILKKYCNLFETLCVTAILLVVFVRTGKHSGFDVFAPLIFMVTVTIFSLEYGYFSEQLKKISYLGTISYSIYLNQITVFMIVSHFLLNRLPETVVQNIFIIVLLVYSHFTYKYIETPLRTRGRNFFSNLVKSKA